MIDIEHAKQEFENYLDEYDRQDEQIYLKIEHTYGVVKFPGDLPPPSVFSPFLPGFRFQNADG